jgi:hypothetical protein
MGILDHFYGIVNYVVTAVQTRITNFIFDLFWKYNYVMIQIEDSRIGQYLKPADTRLVEPALETWSCVASIENGRLLEKYVFNVEPTFHEDGESIWICKTKDVRQVQVSRDDVASVPSQVSFLTVNYQHPDMPKGGLRLVIDPQYMMVGNCLLNRVFVLRLLRYQYNRGDYVFDDRYTLKVMDLNINVRTLTSKQGVVIGLKDYIITPP